MHTAQKAGWLILVVIVLYLLFSFLLPSYSGTEDLLRLYSLNALFVSILAMYVPAIYFMRKNPERDYGRRRITINQAVLAVLLGVSAFLLSTGIGGFMSLAADALDLRDISVPLPRLQGWRAAAAIFIICIVPAITEEQLFRGVLIGTWKPIGRRTAIWLTSVLFALMHGNPVTLPSVLILGLILGSLSIDTRSVYPSMIVHFTNNLITLVLSELLVGAGTEAAAAAIDIKEALTSSALYTGLGLLFVFVYYKRMLRVSKNDASAKPVKEAAKPMTELSSIETENRTSGLLIPIGLSMFLLASMVALNYLYMAGVIQ